MGRTIGAAIGAILIVLFFATVKTHGRNAASGQGVTVSARAQAR